MIEAHSLSAAADATTARARARSDRSSAALHALVLAQLEDDQAIEVVSIPLEGKSSIADHMVIASGRSTRQVGAMAQKLAERSEEHTSELQSLMRISYAVFCLKKKNNNK